MKKIDPLVTIEKGNYFWSLEGNDHFNFWDRFLDGMTEQPEDTVSKRLLRRRQVKEWMRKKLMGRWFQS